MPRGSALVSHSLTVTVYIPAPGSDLRALGVQSGSGIVGSYVGSTGRLRIDFEGDADRFPSFADRVRRAAERHRWVGPDGSRGFPTRACAFVSPDQLIAVGTYNPASRRVDVGRPEDLRAWLSTDRLDEEDLLAG